MSKENIMSVRSIGIGIACGVMASVIGASVAHADELTIVSEWYYSYSSCMNHGRMLARESTSYYGPRCAPNQFNRYTLYMMVRTGGYGGGGSGGWAVVPPAQ